MHANAAIRVMLGLVLATGTVAQAHEDAAAPADASVTLPATVIADPRATLSVVAPEEGELRAPPGGFVVAGQIVRAGQVLGFLRPALPQNERRDIGAELATQRRDEYLDKLQMDRYQVDGSRPFDIKLPTPTVQLVADYRSAHAQAEQLHSALHAEVPITAPVDGVVLRAPARAGRVLAAGATAFELRARSGLAVALDYADDDLDADSAVIARTLSGQTLSLTRIAETRDPLLRSHRLLYAVTGSGAALVGEPLRVCLRRASTTPVARAP